jgi:hypothetical protein
MTPSHLQRAVAGAEKRRLVVSTANALELIAP